MGFDNVENKNWVSIIADKFWIKVPDDQAFDPTDPEGKRLMPNVISRVLGARSPRAGQLEFGRAYNTYHGRLTGMSLKDGNYGKELMLEMDNDVEIQLRYIGQHSEKFLICLPEIDFDKIVYFKTKGYKRKKGKNAGKMAYTWYIQQAGKDVKPAAAERYADGTLSTEGVPILPDKKMLIVNGAEVLSVDDRMDYLYQHHYLPMKQMLDAKRNERAAADNQLPAGNADEPWMPEDDTDHGGDEPEPAPF